MSWRSKYFCKFADRLRQIFDFPVPSDRCGCSVREASWFQCSRRHIDVAIADGRPNSACKQHGSASDRDYRRRGRRNNPAGDERQLCACLWLSRVLALD